MVTTFAARTTRAFPSRIGRLSLASLTLALMAACGGGNGGSDPTAGASGNSGTEQRATILAAGDSPSRAQAFRLLTQASFGPTEASLSQVSSQGVEAWIDAQLALPARAAHLPRWVIATKAAQAKEAGTYASQTEVISTFYQQALQADDQLRHRVAFALSQIFVVSLSDLSNERGQAVADFQDMLGRNAFGNFRTLLRDVALHPAMGLYLSHIKNRMADGRGRMPDQNFAREVMQLFSIGLHELNLDGSLRLGPDGLPIDTYDSTDIEGLSSVFTGFSFAGPDTSNPRFYGQIGARDPNRLVLPMQGYAQFHATEEKQFLGTRVAAQSTADAMGSLNTAIDAMFNHPNVGPFIGRQLIQRLVTSHPSPGYVARVAAVFNNNGLGARGDMKAVVRAILTDVEARDASRAQDPSYGKLREPVLRLTAFLRAFKAKSDSGKVLMGVTDDPGLALGQTPYRSPGVFNFYRPGHVPAGGEAAALGLTLPEMQITSESSVSGYANYMMAGVVKGVGLRGPSDTGPRPDLQPDYAMEFTVSERPAELSSMVISRLLPEASPALAAEVTSAVESIAIPAWNKRRTNGAAINTARRTRIHAAVLLTLASPEYTVQK